MQTTTLQSAMKVAQPAAPKLYTHRAPAEPSVAPTGNILAISDNTNGRVIGAEVRRVCGQLSTSIF